MFAPLSPIAPSNTAQWLTLAYALVLVYVTLHPLGALRWTDAPAWAFLLKPWSKLGVTPFDVWVNVLAYVPLGAGLAWQLGRSRLARWGSRGWQISSVALLATAVGACFSLLLEGIQTFSSVRVASTWDVACNSTGALAGAALALMFKGTGQLSGLERLLAHCIAPQRGALWAVIGLWALAQLHPQGWSFMTAPLSFLTSGWLPTQGVQVPLSAEQLHNLETISSVVALSGMLSLMRLGLHPRLGFLTRSLCLLIGLALVLGWQAGAYSFQYGWGEWRLLANDGVLDALSYVAVLYVAWALLPAPWVVVGAVLALAVHTAMAQMLPAHPYAISPSLWQQSRLIHLYGLTGMVSALWPILALAALVLQSKFRQTTH